MQTLTKSHFNKVIETLSVVSYTDMIAVQDECDNIVEFDTTGNENHVFEDTIFVDGVEYKLTENQKDKLYNLAKSQQTNNGAEAFDSDDYSHFENLIFA